MRLHSTTSTLRACATFALCVSLLAPAYAYAGGHDKAGASSSPAGPGGTSSGSSEGNASAVHGDAEDAHERDVVDKPWEVGGVFETHRLFIQNDLQGYGNDKLVNYLHLFARWDFGKFDGIELRGYVI